MAMKHTSAVCLIPPTSLWPGIQAHRVHKDKSFLRWMPHINLLYPFYGDDEFSVSAAKAAEGLSGIQPFRLTLAATPSHFRHSRQSFTLWLGPDPSSAEPLQQLQGRLVDIFPECTHLSRDETRGIVRFEPHLSLGQCRSEDQVAAWSDALAASGDLEGLSWTVDRVHLISRRGFDEPFQIRYEVPLGAAAPAVEVNRCYAPEVGGLGSFLAKRAGVLEAARAGAPAAPAAARAPRRLSWDAEGAGAAAGEPVFLSGSGEARVRIVLYEGLSVARPPQARNPVDIVSGSGLDQSAASGGLSPALGLAPIHRGGGASLCLASEAELAGAAPTWRPVGHGDAWMSDVSLVEYAKVANQLFEYAPVRCAVKEGATGATASAITFASAADRVADLRMAMASQPQAAQLAPITSTQSESDSLLGEAQSASGDSGTAAESEPHPSSSAAVPLGLLSGSPMRPWNKIRTGADGNGRRRKGKGKGGKGK